MSDEFTDFREVAHCGGKVSFEVSTENGARTYSVGYSGSSPKPMALFAVYALPQGMACGDIQLGGVGAPWNSPPFPDCIPVFIGSDSHGKFGHECPECKGYWRSSAAPSRWPMTCAYCGIRGGTWQFLTSAQRRYTAHYANILMEALSSSEASLEVVIDMDAASDASTAPKPDFYYGGQQQQTGFTCEACGCWNDIRGQYGYCGACGTRNNAQILREGLDRLRERLNEDKTPPADALKSAVSSFDSCCRNLVAQLTERVPLTKGRQNRLSAMLFHGLDPTTDLRTIMDIDLVHGLDAADTGFLRMMFHRRHAFEHDGGHATARYLSESGDTSVAKGSLIRENRENVHRLIGLLNKMAGNFDKGFHELFPPEEKPVSLGRDRQKTETQTALK
jgi:hypothetical protein